MSVVGGGSFDLVRDREKFCVVWERPAPVQPPATHVNLILNWFEELKAKAPVKR